MGMDQCALIPSTGCIEEPGPTPTFWAKCTRSPLV